VAVATDLLSELMRQIFIALAEVPDRRMLAQAVK